MWCFGQRVKYFNRPEQAVRLDRKTRERSQWGARTAGSQAEKSSLHPAGKGSPWRAFKQADKEQGQLCTVTSLGQQWRQKDRTVHVWRQKDCFRNY